MGDFALLDVLARWSVPDAPAAADLIRRYFALLLTWNARINLTGARTVEVLEGEHLPDALAMFRLVRPGARVLDVGAGGGLPALPFAILRPDARVSLLEPRTRRVAFLRTACRDLALTNAEVIEGRLEGQARPARFDLLSSRATFPPAEWFALALPHLGPGAQVLVFSHTGLPPPSGYEVTTSLAYETATHQPRFVAAYQRST
jgi:16S rRNA (guanine527-N7)-methyltransferase